MEFSFNTGSKSEVTIAKTPSTWLDKLPVYLPTRELLTIYPGFVSLYETTYLSFEETWRDTCILTRGAVWRKGPREKRIKELLVPLEDGDGGQGRIERFRPLLSEHAPASGSKCILSPRDFGNSP